MTMGNKEILARNIRKYITMCGKDRRVVAKELNVPYSTLTDWMNARKYPRIDRIERMAEYFKISKSELIEDFEKKQKDNDKLAKIIVKMRIDDDLLKVVDKIVSLDKAKLDSLNNLLDTFI